jgi:hypothetical protein
MCEGGEGGIRKGEGPWRGLFILERDFIHASHGRGDFGSIGTKLVDSGIYSAPRLRGFGLGGLGRPLMS